MRLGLVTLVVNDYDEAIAFFTRMLGFDLVEDQPATTNDGHPKRWVVVRPPGAQTGLLLARADGDRQAVAVGNQTAGRVGFFLDVDDVPATYRRLADAGVQFISPPRTEPYGQVAVFLDIAGNRWDLRGPALPDHAAPSEGDEATSGGHWYRRRWEELRGDAHDDWGPSTWLFETDDAGNVLRQIEVYDHGPTRRYDLDRTEDDDGGLSEISLPPGEWAEYAISRQQFDAAWNDPVPGPPPASGR